MLQDTVKAEVEKMLQHCVIRESSSPWSSPIVMIKKKDGSWRFCVDFRKVNSMTQRDAYHLPRIDETLEALVGSQFFTTLDLASGYLQVEMQKRLTEQRQHFPLVMGILSNAFWTDKCPSHVSEGYEMCVGRFDI